MIRENNYQQLITEFTTDNQTVIHHLYTNIIEEEIHAGILKTYFSDHKTIVVSYLAMPVIPCISNQRSTALFLPLTISFLLWNII